MEIEPLHRLTVRVPAKFTSPVSIASGRPSAVADDEIIRDGVGRPIVPGSSLAGAVRARLASVREDSAVWGSSTEDGSASAISVADAVVGASTVTTRFGVGLDRVSAAAKSGALFEREVIARGATFTTVFSTDRCDTDTLKAIALACRALHESGIHLGGRTSTGLGRFDAAPAEAHLVTLDTADAIADEVIRRLRGEEAPWIPLDELLDDDLRTEIAAVDFSRRTATINIPWAPLRHILIGGSEPAVLTDRIPLAEHDDGMVHLPLPGSALKGVLRAMAERQMRTVIDPDDDDAQRILSEAPLHQQVDVPIVSHLFGSGGDAARDAAGLSPNRRSAITVDEAGTEWACTADEWKAVLDAADPDALHEALADAGIRRGTIEYHIAIERWLGGATDRRFFDNLALHGLDWTPMTLTVDLDRLDDEIDIMLLVHVLQWSACGWTPIGSGSRAGVGDYETETITIKIPFENGPVDLRIDRNGVVDMPDDTGSDLGDLLERWTARLDEICSIEAGGS